jgi:hypothetical protein
MYLLIRYPVGIIVQAIVLAKGRNRMRIAAAGFPDTMELRRSGSRWFTETREPVEFDFLMSSDYQSQTASNSTPAGVARARARAATAILQ